MNSKLIYDVINDSFNVFDFVSLDIVFFGIFAILIIEILYRKSKEPSSFAKRVLFYIVFSIIWIVVNSIGLLFTYSRYLEIRNVRINKEYKIVTGIVRNTEIHHGRTNLQRFIVDGVHFEVADGSYNGGYSKTIQKGAPFFDGRCLKIYYVEKANENVIARLELLNKKACSRKTKK
jgi:hypothetical protein